MSNLQLNPQSIYKDSPGTKLYRRTGPPSDGVEYSATENQNSEFLGYVVAVTGVPRWMSSQFADAVATREQEKADASLELYSDDWMEKIVYVEKNKIPEFPDLDQPEVAAQAVIANSIVMANQPAQHFLAYGCNQVCARTLIHAIGDDKPSAAPYYAIVSKVDPQNPANVFEITIATINNRPKFTETEFHRCVLKRCIDLRFMQGAFHSLAKKRADAFKAIVNSHFQA